MERLRPPGESRVAQMGACLQKREPQESSNILKRRLSGKLRTLGSWAIGTLIVGQYPWNTLVRQNHICLKTPPHILLMFTLKFPVLPANRGLIFRNDL